MEARLKSAKRRAVALIHWSAHRCDAKAAPSFLLKILIFNELLWFLRPHTYKKVVEAIVQRKTICLSETNLRRSSPGTTAKKEERAIRSPTGFPCCRSRPCHPLRSVRRVVPEALDRLGDSGSSQVEVRQTED